MRFQPGLPVRFPLWKKIGREIREVPGFLEAGGLEPLGPTGGGEIEKERSEGAEGNERDRSMGVREWRV